MSRVGHAAHIIPPAASLPRPMTILAWVLLIAPSVAMRLMPDTWHASWLVTLALIVGPLSLLPLLAFASLLRPRRVTGTDRLAWSGLLVAICFGAVFDIINLGNVFQASVYLPLIVDFEQLAGIGRCFCLTVMTFAIFSQTSRGALMPFRVQALSLAFLLVFCIFQVVGINTDFFGSYLSTMSAISCLFAGASGVFLVMSTGRSGQQSPLLFSLGILALTQAFNHILYLSPVWYGLHDHLLLLQNINEVISSAMALVTLSLNLRPTEDGNYPLPISPLTKGQSLDETRSQLLARISHELRTPLHTVVGMSEWILAELPAEFKQRAELDKIRDAGWQLTHMVDDLLDLSTIQRAELTVRETNFDAERFVQVVEKIAKGLAAPSMTEVSVHCPRGFGPIRADENRLLQVCANLIRNSLRYTREGSISLHLYPVHGPDEDRIQIDIRDSGKGMQAEELVHMFKAFSPATGDSPMGVDRMHVVLPSTYELCQKMGILLTVDSCFGRGTTYSLSFVDRLGLDRSGQRQPLAHPRPRVLLFDSGFRGNEDVLQLLNENDVELIRVQKPSSGLRIFFEKCPDLVIADRRNWGEDKNKLLLNISRRDPLCSIVDLYRHDSKAEAPSAPAQIRAEIEKLQAGRKKMKAS